MTQPSLGLIETIGLAAAIEAADAAVKSANVVLVGYELTKGDGMVVVKVQGEVGAVNAAVAAGVAAAAKVSRVASSRVIARPARGIEKLVINADTVGSQFAVAASCRERCVAEPVSYPEEKPAKKAEPESDVALVVEGSLEREPQTRKEASEEDLSGALADSASESDARNPEVRGSLAQGNVNRKVKAQNPDRGVAVAPPPRRTSEKLPTKNRKHRKTKE